MATTDIFLYREDGGWMARSESYREVFGTDTIPTPFHEMVRASQVCATIRELNPDALVSIRVGEFTIEFESAS